MQSMKVFLFILNFTSIIGGCILICVAAFAMDDRISSLGIILDSKLLIDSTIVLLGVGICVIIIAFVGCYGAWRERKFTLLIYFTVVFLLFMLLLAMGIYAFLFGEKIFEFEGQIETSIAEYEKDPVIKDAWDDFQKYGEVCALKKLGEYYPDCIAKIETFIKKHSQQVTISGITVAIILFLCSTSAILLFLEIIKISKLTKKEENHRRN